MEFLKRKKKIGAAFGCFLGFMLLCTLISRSFYASGLPQVDTEFPRRTTLTHTVETEGIVRQDREYAVHTLSGLRCRTVCVHVGDRVTAETVLFEVDLEDLEEQIRAQKLAVRELQLTIQAQEQNKSRLEDEKRIQQERAGEDYERTTVSAQEKVDRARENLEALQRRLEQLKSNPVKEPSEDKNEENQAAQATQSDQADQENQPDQEDQAAQEEQERQEKLEAEKAARKAWEEEVAGLEQQIKEAWQALADARESRDNATLEAERKLADAKGSLSADSSLEINRLELAALKEKLAKYEEIQEGGGLIYPEADGIITGICISPGERISDGAALVYADPESPLQFICSLTKEQKKYVNQGDRAELVLEGNRRDVTVDYIAESGQNPGMYDVTLFLDEGTGSIGQSGILTVTSQTENLNCCVPLDALYMDETQRNFVYTLGERPGILGTELSAQKVYVKVLDKNESYAALEEGVIDSETEVIVSASKELADRAAVRYRE